MSRRADRHRATGFTLVELLVALGLLSLLLASLFSLLASAQRVQAREQAVATITENLRVATEAMARDIYMAGYSGTGSALRYVDPTEGCTALAVLQASDFQLTLLADRNGSAEAGDAPDSPGLDFYGQPLCVDDACGSCASPLSPGQLHAEVVRWSLDADGDGVQRDGSGTLRFDAAGEALAEAVDEDDVDGISPNPHDSMLYREWSTAGSTTGLSVPVAYGVRGPAAPADLPRDADGDPHPLFAYWLDMDGDGAIQAIADGGADVLHGDSDANGVLDAGELPAGSVPREDLQRIVRVEIFLRAESDRPEARVENGYRFATSKRGVVLMNQHLHRSAGTG